MGSTTDAAPSADSTASKKIPIFALIRNNSLHVMIPEINKIFESFASYSDEWIQKIKTLVDYEEDKSLSGRYEAAKMNWDMGLEEMSEESRQPGVWINQHTTEQALLPTNMIWDVTELKLKGATKPELDEISIDCLRRYFKAERGEGVRGEKTEESKAFTDFNKKSAEELLRDVFGVLGIHRNIADEVDSDEDIPSEDE